MAILFHLIKANGWVWSVLYLAERALKSSFFADKRLKYELRKSLPGFNTVRYNYKEWNNYDWSRGGEEWTDSEAWKASLIEDVLKPWVTEGQTILEIGPGAGRWSSVLARFARKLILVDIAENALATCQTNLSAYSNIEYVVTQGSNLEFIPNQSVDLVWSFDVFVHIAPKDTEAYLVEIARILKKSGVAIIHHPAEGGIHGGFRSSVTNDFFTHSLTKANLRLIQRFSTWGPGQAYSVGFFKDSISIIGPGLS